jgi:high-affinity iron transporter
VVRPAKGNSLPPPPVVDDEHLAMPNVFSVTVFFLVFRETLEAALIISVLLGLVKQIVHDDKSPLSSTIDDEKHLSEGGDDDATRKRKLLRRLRLQVRFLNHFPLLPPANSYSHPIFVKVFTGAGLGLFIALAIGAAFIAVWFTQAYNLWAKSEALWEGRLCRARRRAATRGSQN